jgi:hypothetical protein
MYGHEDFTQVNFGVWCLDTATHEYIFQRPTPYDTVSYAAKRGKPVLLVKPKGGELEIIDVKDADEALFKINQTEDETPPAKENGDE